MGVCSFQINLHCFTIAQVLEYSVDDLLTALIREMEAPKSAKMLCQLNID